MQPAPMERTREQEELTLRRELDESSARAVNGLRLTVLSVIAFGILVVFGYRTGSIADAFPGLRGCITWLQIIATVICIGAMTWSIREMVTANRWTKTLQKALEDLEQARKEQSDQVT